MPKNIILCFDGTKENFGPQPYTNVLKIYRLLDTTNQVCYYQPGIGTAADFDSADDLQHKFTLSSFKNTLDSMFAFCLDDHIMSAYLYLMKHYERGDSVYMFGFSRGAFIARVLAGMVERVGLLNEGLDGMVKMAWNIYESWEFAEQPSQPNYTTTLIEEFRKIFSRDYEVRVHFQGLFDSVNSVGLFRERLFPCTQRSNIVEHVRHAISIDERRGKFKQLCFTPNPYKPEFFSLNYKSYIKNNIYLESSCSTSPINSSNSIEDISGNDLQQKDIDNPLINYTIHRWVGIDLQSDNTYIYHRDYSKNERSSSYSFLKKLFRGLVDDNEMDDTMEHYSSYQFCKSVNTFLQTSNPNACNYAVCSNSTVEGVFHLRPARYDEPMRSRSETKLLSDSSLCSDDTLTPDLVEKWFPGDHCDIGGGWKPDCRSQDFLSNIALRWMLAEAIKNGVKFKPGVIGKFASKYSSLGSLSCSAHDYLNCSCSDKCNTNIRSEVNGLNKWVSNLEINHKFIELQSEEHLEDKILGSELSRTETMAQLFTSNCGHIGKFMTFFWWVLEFLPIGIRVEDLEGKWRNVYIPNFGRSRYIPQYADMHWSVYWRIKFNENYRPDNLPDYVYELIDHIKILSHGNTVCHPNLTESSEIPFLINDDSTRIEPLLSRTIQTDEELFSNLIRNNYHESLFYVMKWQEDRWQNIPDDLLQLLIQHPNL